MINKERTRALKEIVEAEEARQAQPVEGISSAFEQGSLETEVQSFCRCFDQHEGHYTIVSRYYEYTTHVFQFVMLYRINYL